MFDKLTQAYLPEMNFPIRKVDHDSCSRCGRCYEVCPCGGFTWKKGEFPVPVGFGGFKEACINCHNCITVCPTDSMNVNGSFAIKKGRYKNQLTGRMMSPNPFGAFESPAYEEIEEQLTPIEKLIFTRRSNRLFKSSEVPKELLNRILEAGRYAPSAGNCQPYHFIVITDQAVIRDMETQSMRVLRLLKNAYLSKNGKRRLWKNLFFTVASFMMPNKFDPRPMTAMEKADRNLGAIYFNAPAVILILKNKNGISNPDLDAGICTQNMVLAAHGLGLGTCIISLPMVPLSYPIMARFRKKIGIKYPFECVTSIAIGFPKGKIDGVVKRDTPPVTWLT